MTCGKLNSLPLPSSQLRTIIDLFLGYGYNQPAQKHRPASDSQIRNQSSLMKFLDSLKTKFGFITPNPEMALVPQLVKRFLTPAIKQRAALLASAENAPLESYHKIVFDEFSKRMKNTIHDEIRHIKEELKLELSFPAFLENRLDRVFFPKELEDADFADQKSFERLLRNTRSEFGFAGLLSQKPLPPEEARVIASLLLRSTQKAALQAISNYYPPTDRPVEVKPPSIETIKDLLKKLDVFANSLLPNPGLKNLPRAEAELNVAVARSELRVQLPVRSIPTSPLTDTDLQNHYIGRSDEDAKKLARQVRHADGTILVTGYRGVGKSTFVNRVIYHATRYQQEIPKDGWLVVPVTVNLAKVSGVSNILRLTLRSVRNALINPDTAEPQPIPCFLPESPLPLNPDTEIAPLQEAYARATYKVSMTRANASENKFSLDGSLGFDISKIVAPVSGFQLPSFGLKGSKSRTQTFNRTLSYYDYDENAAEDDLMSLISKLASERPLYEKGPNVRIKVVFIFDELDKMDMKTGVNPMIEGLKNLFLQRHAVFILVTSKMFYYHLQAERAKEDSMLSSYFSAIVSVPLLTFEQARKMVQDWVDWPEGTQIPDIETNLLDQLTRWLVYKTYGNPRDIIRELRTMQEWADTTERPYISDRRISDRSTRSQSLQIFAGIQQCIENVARPEEETGSSTKDSNDLILVSERLGGDEGRLEQIRRGLYVFTEALIDRGTLSLKPDDLEQLRTDNFSLLTLPELEQLAIQLGNALSLLHKNLPKELFAPLAAPELFEKVDGTRLRTTAEFYRLTKRQMTVTEAQIKPSPKSDKSVPELIADAEALAKLPDWSSRFSAIGLIKQIGSSQISASLASFLLKLSLDKNEEVGHRREAARQLTSEMLFKADNLLDVVTGETDDEILSLFLPLLGKATDEASRRKALEAILALFKRRSTNGYSKILAGKNAENALNVLPGLANQDVLNDLLDWLCSTAQTPEVQEATLTTLNRLSQGTDQAEKIISNDVYLKYFVKSSHWKGLVRQRLPAFSYPLQTAYALASSLSQPESALAVKYQTHLRSLFSSNPLRYAKVLLHFDKSEDVTSLLQSLWQLAFERDSAEFAKTILSELENDEPWIKERLANSLWQTPEFEVRILPAIQQVYARESYSEEKRKKLDARIAELVAAGEKPKTTVADPKHFLDRFKSLDSPKIDSEFLSKFSVASNDPWSKFTQTGLYPPARKSIEAPGLGLTLLVASVVVGTLLIDVFLYKRDLPPAATLSQAIMSRLALFFADFAIVATFSLVAKQVKESTDRITYRYSAVSYKTSSFSLSSFVGYVPLLGTSLFYFHIESLGPLSFWNQLFLFLINLPATFLLSQYVIELLPSD